VIFPASSVYSTPWMSNPRKLYPWPPNHSIPSNVVCEIEACATVPGDANRHCLDPGGNRFWSTVLDVLNRIEDVTKVDFVPFLATPSCVCLGPGIGPNAIGILSHQLASELCNEIQMCIGRTSNKMQVVLPISTRATSELRCRIRHGQNCTRWLLACRPLVAVQVSDPRQSTSLHAEAFQLGLFEFPGIAQVVLQYHFCPSCCRGQRRGRQHLQLRPHRLGLDAEEKDALHHLVVLDVQSSMTLSVPTRRQSTPQIPENSNYHV